MNPFHANFKMHTFLLMLISMRLNVISLKQFVSNTVIYINKASQKILYLIRIGQNNWIFLCLKNFPNQIALSKKMINNVIFLTLQT